MPSSLKKAFMGLASKLKQEVTGTIGAPGSTSPQQPYQSYGQQPPQQNAPPGASGNYGQPQYQQPSQYPPQVQHSSYQAEAGANQARLHSSQPQAYGAQGMYPPQGTYGAPPQQASYGQPQTYGMPAQFAGTTPRPQQQQQQMYGNATMQPNAGSYTGYPPGPNPYQQQQSYQQQQPYQQQQSYQQQQPYQQQQSQQNHGMMQQSSNDAAASMLSGKLQGIIAGNNLQRFYDPAKFRAVLNKVLSINFDAVASQWHISRELAYDLAPLALYDIVFYCDDSGSMSFEENGKRIQQLKAILERVSAIATLFDDDGIVVRFMNSNVNGDGIRNPAEVSHLLSQVKYTGVTPLGTNFDKKVVAPFVMSQAMSGNMAKPILAVIITDGEPLGEPRDALENVIRAAKESLMKTRFGGGALAVQIAQVGSDMAAQAFLAGLDNHPIVGKMIDCTSGFELEQMEYARKGVDLTQELWTLKVCVGAIDTSYDEAD